MAWNEKALKQLNKAPVRVIDVFDIEADREGNARRFFQSNDLKPQLGRRISKTNRQQDGRGKTADFIATRNLVKDTAAAVKAHTVPDSGRRYNLRTVA